MVTNDRGQLMLVGAIIVAITFLGLTTLLNSVVFTENVGGGSSVEVTGDVTEFNREARRNAQALAIRINHDGNYSLTSTIEENLDRNFTQYSDRLAESYADTSSVYVNLSHEKVLVTGKRIVQTEDANFTKGGTEDWDVYTGGTTDIGWFVFNLNASEVSESDKFRLLIDNSSSTQTITFQQDRDGRILVNSTIDGAHTSNVSCTPTGGRVLLDVLDGTSAGADCSFNGTDRLAGPYTRIRFEDSSNGFGKYDVVVNDSANVGVPPCDTDPEPCRMEAAWKIQITTRYQTASISFENTQNVSVYNDP